MKKVTRYCSHSFFDANSLPLLATYEADGCVHFEPIPDYGDHVILNNENLNWMLWGDGSCYYATATKRSRITTHSGNHPAWATHLVYFGK